MRFEHPLALLGALAIPWIWAAASKRPSLPRAVVVWRSTIALLAILAASGLGIWSGDTPVTTVVSLDRSASVPVHVQQRGFVRADALRSTMRPEDRLSLVAFGADAAIEWRALDRRQSGSLRADVITSGTDIGGALRLARTLLPADRSGRILLISDGRDGGGNAEGEALRAAAAGVPIDIAPAVTEPAAMPLLVTQVTAPDTAAIREPYQVSIELSGAPKTRGRLVIYRDDQAISTSDVTTGENGTADFSLTERQDLARAYTYRAALELSDGMGQHNAPGAVVTVEGQPSILYVSPSAAPLGPALTAAGFRVVTATPARANLTAAALSAFAAIVLDDVAAEDLGSGGVSALAEFVENRGGGLLLLGSPRTLALTGYPATPLDRILPVDLRPRAGERATPAELVLVFDKSGSMSDVDGGVSKIEAARQAVMDTVRLLPPTDAIGVLAFDTKPQVVTEMTAAPDQKVLQTALGDVRPGGSTAISPAIDTALQWFRARGGASATRRQIVLISDGRTSDDDAARLRQMVRGAGVEVSAVAIGANANRALLEELAATTGGRAYFPANLSDLPGAVAREAARSSAGGIVQERFTPHAATHPILKGIDTTALPPLGGYVVGATKPTAAAILSSHLDDPILAAWRAGLGRVAVFTADLESPWSAGLRSWRNGGQMWTQAVRWLGRSNAGSPLQAHINNDGPAPRLIVDAMQPDGSLMRLSSIQATVRGPSGAARDVALDPIAPGRYGATLAAGEPGAYVVAVTATEQETGLEHHSVRSIYWSADQELRTRGVDMPLLSRIAGMTGGRILLENESPFEAPRKPGYTDATWWLAAVALAMFVLDVASATEIGRRAWRRLGRQPQTRPEDRVVA